MNKVHETLIATSLLIGAAAGCAPNSAVESEQGVNPDVITSQECADPYIPAETGILRDLAVSDYGRTLARQKGADAFAIDDDLPEAIARHEDIMRDLSSATPNGGEPYSPVGYTADEISILTAQGERFLSSPDEMQAALKAECAAEAGKITLATQLLGEITDPLVRAEEGDRAERWIAFHAEQAAKEDANFDEAFAQITVIDSAGSTTQATARDEVENWVEFHAEQTAKNEDDYSVALSLVDRIDHVGTITQVEARDKVENWVEFGAQQAARAGDYSTAKELAAMADDKGRITKATILDTI